MVAAAPFTQMNTGLTDYNILNDFNILTPFSRVKSDPWLRLGNEAFARGRSPTPRGERFGRLTSAGRRPTLRRSWGGLRPYTARRGRKGRASVTTSAGRRQTLRRSGARPPAVLRVPGARGLSACEGVLRPPWGERGARPGSGGARTLARGLAGARIGKPLRPGGGLAGARLRAGSGGAGPSLGLLHELLHKSACPWGSRAVSVPVCLCFGSRRGARRD